MNEMLSQEEIDRLLEKIKNETPKLSIIEIKPSEIDKIRDIDKREYMKYQFEIINELFVEPLEKVFEHINKINNLNFKFDIADLSIIDRMRLYEKMLLRSGYTASQIFDLVPQTKEDVSILLTAKENGFIDNKILNNRSRIVSAKDYLEHIKIINNLRKIK